MKCPNCGHVDNKVVDSRHTENSSIRRRRECLSCQKRFTTYESIEVMPIVVVKKDGSSQEFDRQKIKSGLIKSCYKRPVTNEQMERLISQIYFDLANSMKTEVTSVEIGHMVVERLKQLDEISYVRFASVYREFRDVESLMREIQTLKDQE